MTRQAIILNGPPAVGKTTVSRLFQSKRYSERAEVWLHVPIDVFDEMTPRGLLLSDEEYAHCTESMCNALTGIAAADIQLIVEVVVRRDPTVVELFQKIRSAVSCNGRVVSLVSLLSSDSVRRSRAGTRATRIPAWSFDAALDPSTLSQGEVLSTSEMTPQDVCLKLSELADGL